uniref:Uncharacterized protein n=1 Tax=viral metagenome TaxID=1070528 RepID=A0A6C0HMB2_9ZZZZ
MDDLVHTFPEIRVDHYERSNTLTKYPCFIVPKGKKVFAWFTRFEKQPICIFLHSQCNEIQKIYHYYVSFKEELCEGAGTVLYGTLLDRAFVAETLYYYRGKYRKDDFMVRLSLLKECLGMIRTSFYLGSITFHLPHTCFQRGFLDATTMPYDVYGLLQLSTKPQMVLFKPLFATFLIKKREETEDVYELYALNDQKQNTFYSTALVNDFKTSHFLRRGFHPNVRSYKEMEESDSDEEGPKISEKVISCIFIPEFRRWKPYVFETKKMDSILFIQNQEKKISG